ESVETKLKESESQVAQLEESNAALQQTIAKQQESTDALQKKLEASEQQLIEKDEALAQRELELNRLREERDRQNSLREQLRAELEQAQQRSQQERADFEQRIRESEQKSGELQNQLQSVRGELAVRENALMEREKQTTEMKEIAERSLQSIENRDIGTFSKLFRNLLTLLGIRAGDEMPDLGRSLAQLVQPPPFEQQEVTEKLPSRRTRVIDVTSVPPVIRSIPTIVPEQQPTQKQEVSPVAREQGPAEGGIPASIRPQPGLMEEPSVLQPIGQVSSTEPTRYGLVPEARPYEPDFFYPDAGYEPEPFFGGVPVEPSYPTEPFMDSTFFPPIAPVLPQPARKPVEPVMLERPRDVGGDKPMNPLAVVKHLNWSNVPRSALRTGIESLGR
ncbi:hypothetical protein KJZ61_03895, partial [Candidatus Dependentiae bacterium]|nr:hypothetical protein [Candidatus Dependentiae bacterium]